MSKVRVFGETLGNHIRELIVGRAVNETNDAGGDVGFDVVTFEDKSVAIGGGPVLGLAFNINDKISLYTEGAAYFTNGNSSNSEDFKKFPEFNNKSDDITETSFNVHIPTTLYLVFTFYISCSLFCRH